MVYIPLSLASFAQNHLRNNSHFVAGLPIFLMVSFDKQTFSISNVFFIFNAFSLFKKLFPAQHGDYS